MSSPTPPADSMPTATDTATPTPTRHTYPTGGGFADAEGECIESQAKAAAQAGRSLADSCPYPFASLAGQHFVSHYYLHKQAAPNTARVLAKAAQALEISR